jgi:crossover junction endodeoxyribonuclease RuvC
VIVAFDTSTRRTGWVRGEPGGPVHVGSFGLREAVQGNIGRMLTEWAEHAWPLIEGCTHVYFEAPIIPYHGNVKSLRPLWAITAHVEFLAHHAKADCAEIANNEQKQLIYGHGGAKPENATEYAAAWGLPAENSDEADACGVFLFAIKSEFPEAFDGWLDIRRQAPPITRISPPKKARRKGAKRAGRGDPSLF